MLRFLAGGDNCLAGERQGLRVSCQGGLVLYLLPASYLKGCRDDRANDPRPPAAH